MTPDQVIQTIFQETTRGHVRLGQTGAYHVFFYWMPAVFGADLSIVRAPSAVAAMILVLSAAYFLRVNGLSRIWQATAILAFAGQGTLIYFAGEARPYIFIASFAVAGIAYFRVPPEGRSKPVPTLLGVYSLLLGSVFHPYFILFFLIAYGFNVWLAVRADRLKISAKALVSFSSPYLAIPALFLYLATASVTWLKGEQMPSGLQPFEHMGSPNGVFTTIFSTHFELLRFPIESNRFVGLVSLVVAASIILFLMFMLGKRSPASRRILIEPLALIGAGLFSTAALVGLSLIQGYWILQRQWVGGIALVEVGAIWLVGLLYKLAKEKTRYKLGIQLVIVLIALNALAGLTIQVASDYERFQAWQNYQPGSYPVLAQMKVPVDNSTWVEIANSGIRNSQINWELLNQYYLPTK